MSLQRFMDAQEASYFVALKEIKQGRKQSHWMWYIFPQIKGLGYSSTAKYYAIEDTQEALCYVNHPVLGNRLREITKVVLVLEESNITKVMGFPDDMKLKSCMTLFYLVSKDELYKKVLDKYYDGKLDEKTVDIIGG